PDYEILPAPEFDLLSDTILCEGASIQISPSGTNLANIYCPELDQTADDFYIEADAPATYTFIATDDYGCQSDTASMSVDISMPSIDTGFVALASCYGQSNASILIETTGEVSTIQWNNGNSGPFIDNLSAGTYTVLLTDIHGCTDNAQYEVPEPDPLEAEVFEITPFTCNNTNDAAVEVFPEGGTPPYAYTWGPIASSTAVLSGISPGTYTVTVTDANNCTTAGTISIPDPPQLEASALQDSVSCANGTDGSATVLISGGFPGYTVVWDDPDQQATTIADGLQAGTYTVTVTDASNCEVTASVEVLEPLPLTISMVADSTSCHHGQDGTATATVSGGTPGYSYLWNDPYSQTTPYAVGLSGGNFAVSVTDHHDCEIIGHVGIPVPPPIDMSFVVDSVSCHGDKDGYAIVSAAGGSPDYQFSWGAPLFKTGPAVTNLTAGSYPVEVTDAEGCKNDTVVVIAQPDPLIAQPLESFFPDCDNDLPGEAIIDVTGGNGQYQYQWSDGSTEPTITSWRPATFSVTVTDQKDCQAETSVEIQVFEIGLEELGLTTSPNFPQPHVCLTDSVWLSLSANNDLREINWFATS
ncbi:MAG: SprB repeat-containing protein, partial [Phaeodactylibacter sp.]|nr:SprB repeat-containing protein [Phaeodactylibacter sp.]